MAASERESMELDVLYIGAGIANLTSAYALMKGVREHNAKAAASGAKPLDEPVVLVVDKGQNVGSHVLSGAVVDPVAFRELFPELREEELPFFSPVTDDSIYYLTGSGKIPVPAPVRPREMRNAGCHLASLAEVTRWMAGKCQEVGVEVYTEFAATELIMEGDTVKGARIADKGLARTGEPGEAFTPGMDIEARVTVIGEGTRGFLAQQLIGTLGLADGANPQVWALGIKELIRVPEGRLEKGAVIHAFGYPLDMATYGGAFVYAFEKDLVGVGLVMALDYPNPLMDVHDMFLLLKRHPLVAGIIEGGEVVEYGAKTLPEGGFFALPALSAHGAVLVGDSAGMLNAMRLKGIHLAMKSGMLAAERIVAALESGDTSAAALDYRAAFDASWAGRELRRTRNYRQGFHHGLLPGMMLAGMHMFTGGALPAGRMKLPPDYTALGKASRGKPTPKTRTDQKLYLDIMTDVFKSGSVHREDQPCHCRILDTALLKRDHEEYASPCTRFCPAEVYELVTDESGRFADIRINFSNCVHCKTCEIKDPLQNIRWTPPEGGDGPRYKQM